MTEKSSLNIFKLVDDKKEIARSDLFTVHPMDNGERLITLS